MVQVSCSPAPVQLLPFLMMMTHTNTNAHTATLARVPITHVRHDCHVPCVLDSTTHAFGTGIYIETSCYLQANTRSTNTVLPNKERVTAGSWRGCGKAHEQAGEGEGGCCQPQGQLRLSACPTLHQCALQGMPLLLTSHCHL